MEAPTTNIPAKSTTVELDRPLNTCLAGIRPNRPHATEAPIAVTARGISSVTKNNATTANRIRHLIAGDIVFLLKIIKMFCCLCVTIHTEGHQ